MSAISLRRQVLDIAADAGARTVAVGVYDFEHRTSWSIDGDRWFHAASTIKVPMLVGIYAAIESGRFRPYSRLHVRNRFLSVVDGSPYRIGSARDANSAVHAAIGKTMPIEELARHMIVTSSNLATNLLLDLVGLDAMQETLTAHGFMGIELRRGVEDEKAWEAGLNNRVTANGLVGVLRAIAAGEAVSREASARMIEILHGQQFRSGIPAGLPDSAKVAHKTGEISTVAHDVGIVFLEAREPFVLVVLTEWDPDSGGRHRAIARISQAVHSRLTEREAREVDA